MVVVVLIVVVLVMAMVVGMLLYRVWCRIDVDRSLSPNVQVEAIRS
jgi:hypothetical protein